MVCVSVIDFFLSGNVSEPILLQYEQFYESSELVKLAQFPNLSLEDAETSQGLCHVKRAGKLYPSIRQWKKHKPPLLLAQNAVH